MRSGCPAHGKQQPAFPFVFLFTRFARLSQSKQSTAGFTPRRFSVEVRAYQPQQLPLLNKPPLLLSPQPQPQHKMMIKRMSIQLLQHPMLYCPPFCLHYILCELRKSVTEFMLICLFAFAAYLPEPRGFYN